MRTMALMQVADRRLEMTEREVPTIGRDAALLEVETCGLCGSDVEQFKGNFTAKGLVRYPELGSFARLHTRSFPLDQTAEAIETLAGEGGEGAICISIHP